MEGVTESRTLIFDLVNCFILKILRKPHLIWMGFISEAGIAMKTKNKKGTLCQNWKKAFFGIFLVQRPEKLVKKLKFGNLILMSNGCFDSNLDKAISSIKSLRSVVIIYMV